VGFSIIPVLTVERLASWAPVGANIVHTFPDFIVMSDESPNGCRWKGIVPPQRLKKHECHRAVSNCENFGQLLAGACPPLEKSKGSCVFHW